MSQEIWSAKESRLMNLKDKRRNERVTKILALLAESPESGILQASAGSTADAKAIYRLINNTRIDEQDILEGHYNATAERALQEKERIIVVSDGMDYSFKNLPKTKGLGPLSNGINSLGIKLHNTLAVSAQGMPLGLLYQDFWVRDKSTYGKRKMRHKRDTKDKESNHWIEALDHVERRLPKEIGYVFIGDGAADMRVLFAAPRRANSSILVHMAQNRKIAGEEDKFFEKLEKAEPIGRFNKLLTRRVELPERTVTFEIKIAKVQIAPPRHKDDQLEPLLLYAILAKEIHSDVPVAEPVVWRLLSTDPIDSLADAISKIDLYAQRWLIERYHYHLKQGCKVEKLQLESVDNLKRMAALYAIIAWRLMHLTYIARVDPYAPCTKILSEDEWKALWCYSNKQQIPPKIAPTNKEAVLMLAKLGGFLDRKNDGEPGARVIWRGLSTLESITKTYLIFKE